jgi:NAD(P)-dependent dehydrogenase (short-subunit alcohol dehydrogenase family)
MPLSEKIFLVTGASRGIGRAIAIAICEAGGHVAITARSHEGLKETAKATGGALIIPADACDATAIKGVVDEVINHYGRIDGLVNNAGIIEPISRLEAAEPTAWSETLNLNLIAPTIFSKLSLPYLRENKGAIINVSSGAAHRPLEGWAAYCASKAGLFMLTKALHLEEGSAVDVYGVMPGTVDTEMQALIRSSGINPVSKIPRANLAPAMIPAAGVAWLLATRPEDLKGIDVNVRENEFLKRANIQINST